MLLGILFSMLRIVLIFVSLFLTSALYTEIKDNRYSSNYYVKVNRPVNKAVLACFIYCTLFLTLALFKPDFTAWQMLACYLVVPICIFMILGFANQIIVRNKLEKQKHDHTKP